MKVSDMEGHSEIEACRTCGTFFLTSSNLLRYLFSNEPEILMVRKELESWQMKLNENDAFPNYICTICLLEFHRIFKFQCSVINTQEQLQQLYNLQQENIQKIKIKTEICEDSRFEPKPTKANSLPQESNVCAFIYVDDLSDEEYDKPESRNITPFKVPHIPIKDEIIEEAYIPKAEETFSPQMSVLALTQATQATTQVQPIQELAPGIQCHLCLHVSEDQQQHRQHLLRIHETKPVECHICGKQFPPGTTETRLKYHMKWHRINKHIKCSQCGFHCPSRDVLSEHMRAVHTKVPCKICGKLLLPRKMRLHFEKHQKSQETTQNLVCPFCTSCFEKEEERSQHISLFHNIVNEQLSMSPFTENTEVVTQNITLNSLQSDSETPGSSCETTSTTIISFSPTDEAYEESDELNDTNSENMDSHTTDQNLAGECASESVEAEMENPTDDTNSYEVNEHVDGLEEMQFACAQCPQSFARVEQLIAHAETHNEKIKPFECNVCGKAFDLKFSLNRHMKKHKNTTL